MLEQALLKHPGLGAACLAAIGNKANADHISEGALNDVRMTLAKLFKAHPELLAVRSSDEGAVTLDQPPFPLVTFGGRPRVDEGILARKTISSVICTHT